MPYYVVCTKKRNNPRIDVRICASKCAEKDVCKAYRIFCEMLVPEKNQVTAHEPPSPAPGVS